MKHREARSDRYGIRADYQCNTDLVTMDDQSGSTYWNEHRIASSRHYQFGVYELLSDVIEMTGARSIADVGCGVGTKLEAIHEKFPEVEIHGVDQASAIDWCRDNWTFGQWYADDFENPTGATSDLTVDVVVCADVIEHVLDPDLVLRYLESLAHERTVFVISTPDRERLRGADNTRSPNPHHVREWTADEFRTYLEGAGYRMEQHVHQLPVRAAASRLFVEEVLLRAVRLRSVRYNQVVVARRSS